MHYPLLLNLLTLWERKRMRCRGKKGYVYEVFFSRKARRRKKYRVIRTIIRSRGKIGTENSFLLCTLYCIKNLLKCVAEYQMQVAFVKHLRDGWDHERRVIFNFSCIIKLRYIIPFCCIPPCVKNRRTTRGKAPCLQWMIIMFFFCFRFNSCRSWKTFECRQCPSRISRINMNLFHSSR